jgi:hypothetical protein
VCCYYDEYQMPRRFGCGEVTMALLRPRSIHACWETSCSSLSLSPPPFFFTSWRHTFGQARALLLHPTSHLFPHNHMIAQSFLCSVPPVKSRDEKRQFQRLFLVQPWITKRRVVQTQILLRYAPSTAHALRHCVTCELEMYAT